MVSILEKITQRIETIPRISEYKAFFYRIGLAYVFYFIARVLFYFYNSELMHVETFGDFISICYHGMAFDTTAIFYANLLFLAMSVLPLWKNTTKGYQTLLFYVYFITNLLIYSINFIDFIYYRFSLSRFTITVFDVIKHEDMTPLVFSFIIEYWHVLTLFILCSALWIFLYKRVSVKEEVPTKKVQYFALSSFIFACLFFTTVIGIRGWAIAKATIPINLVDAGTHIRRVSHANLVLNSSFTFLRTMFTSHFKKINFPEVNEDVIAKVVQPYKQYNNNPETKPNVIIFILESFGREYLGAFNKDSNIPDYKSHTPFIDSLAQHSLIFPNAFSNGRQSIHAMSSILAGIPTYNDAFTSSPFANQEIESLVSTLKSSGYNTSFFHGAQNGSMGFLGFANILGIDKYYGRTEFNDDNEFDGYWGIWDEPFLQYVNKTITTQKEPFFSTIFTLTSHEPYHIPDKYKDRFKEGEIIMHKCVEYTDFSLQRFFHEAKKTNWYKNTIFVMVADHGNMNYYPAYNKPMNYFTVPILFFSPNGKYVGVDKNLAQQIDIYPTILNMVGYPKPFRSWGRSLMTKDDPERFVVNSTRGEINYFTKGNYICVFDGKKVNGFYDIKDRMLANNLIANRNAEMDALELQCKAFYQDYMNRVMDKKLSNKSVK